MKTKLIMKIVSIFIILNIGMPISIINAQQISLKDRAQERDNMPPVEFDESLANLPYYSDILNTYRENGYKDTQGSKIVLTPEDAVRTDEEDNEILIKDSVGDYNLPFLICNEREDFEWQFNVENEGLYQIEIIYHTLEGRGNNITRRILINGESPFAEALTLSFPRKYRPIELPRTDSNGDHIRPRQEQVFTIFNHKISDAGGFYTEPLRFYFPEGENSLKLNYANEPFAIARINIISPEDIKKYEDVKSVFTEQGYEEVSDFYFKKQAENNLYSSEPTLRPQSNSDPMVQPVAAGDFILNVFGDGRWTRGNQSATWEIEVAQKGLYQIAIKAGQWFNSGHPSSRQILINGQVPFEEFLNYRFTYSRDWQMVILSDDDGNPLLVPLEEGKNTLSLAVKMGDMGPIVNKMSEFSLRMSALIREITIVTGYEPDPNFEYQLDRQIPGLMDTFQILSEDIQKQMNELEVVSGTRPSEYFGMRGIKRTLDEMIKNPDRITVRFAELQRAHSDFGNWVETLQSNPLTIDFICITSPGYELPRARANFFEKFVSGVKIFIKSFVKDYDNVGNIDDYDVEITDSIEVWVSLGREWSEALRDLIDNEFTPANNTKIVMNTFPAGQLASGAVNVLLLAINSGRAPDVAIGVDHRSPVEFAIRGATTNLEEFEDFEEIKSWFINNAFIPYEYGGGTYAIPCQQDFSVLYYRKDILHELGLGIPQSWDDLYSILPVLYANSMSFYAPPIFDPFLFQSGGNYYTEDGMFSGLDTPQAYDAFRRYTELFTNYKVPLAANFYNRFRSGEMPIGVGGYGEYVYFNIAAPEIQGLWGMAPYLGTVQPDGTINRTTGSLTNNTNIIMEQSDKKDISWEFIKWWMGKETQINFGRQIEAIIGLGARWNSANVDAFKSLPWSENEIDVITTQWNNFMMEPVVLGSYSTARYMMFAWNNVVISGQNPRDALEEAVKAINKELRVKQEEYGVLPE